MELSKSRVTEMDVALLTARYVIDDSSPTGLRWADTGKVAGSYGTSRSKIVVNYTYLLTHRVIWVIATQSAIPEDIVIDHIDGDIHNNTITNLRAVPREVNSRNNKRRSNNSTGVTGVCLKTKGKFKYYVAEWVEGTTRCGKWFAVNELGEAEALNLAIEYRASQIARLNAEGYGYSNRHGL